VKYNYAEFTKNNTSKVGQSFFYLGTFFLSTALPISGIFFIFSIIISFIDTKLCLLQNKWNLSILFIGGLFIFNSLRLNLINFDSAIYIDKKIISLDLFNWIPLFILFISSQHYLKNHSQRCTFSKYLISGTIPVLISCLMQYSFKIYGPFKTFYGLIVIFNKKIGIEEGFGVSGLFSNPNYTGIWLSISLPLLLFLIYKYKSFNYKKLFLFFTLLFLIYFIFLTSSRNAIAGLLSTLLIIFGIKKIFIFLFLIFLIYLSFGVLEPFINVKNLNLIGEFQMEGLTEKLSINNFSNIKEFIRVKIWINTMRLLIQKPLFGFGASTFPLVFYNLTNLKVQHSHNMPLQLAYDYGLPISILLTTFVTFLFIRSSINIFQAKDSDNSFLFNKCWLAACLVAILNHMNDITYYDGKISILIWIILAGLKCIFDETNKKNKAKI